MWRLSKLSLIGLSASLLLSCRPRVVDSSAMTASPGASVGQPEMCVGLRGNGQKIMTLFMGLARQTELFGAPEGVVGGSSGSITAFFYESIVTNPMLRQSCGDNACSDEQANQRVALLLKSLVGYFNDVADHSPVRVFRTLMGVPNFKDENGAVQRDGNWLQRKFGQLTDDLKARKRQAEEIYRIVQQTIDNSDLRDLVDAGLLNELYKALKARDLNRVQVTFNIIVSAVKGVGNFTAVGPELFLRPRVLNFENVGKRFGIVADFYAGAGYENNAAYRNGMNAFLNACAKSEVSYDKDWPTIAGTKLDNGKTCADLFKTWLQSHKNDNEAGIRINETIGSRTRFDGKRQKAIAVTSLIVDKASEHPSAVDKWEEAKTKFLATGVPEAPVDWGKVGFGYWGNTTDLTAVVKSKNQYFAQASDGTPDAKVERFVAIGSAPWSEILSFSPAEPGSSPMTRIPHLSADGRVIASAGGWPDHLQSQLMRGMGCGMVSFMTRPDADKFSVRMAKLLGIDAVPGAYDRLFNPDVKESSFSRSFRYADTSLCYDWDNPKYNGGPESLVAMASDYYRGFLSVITDPSLYPADQAEQVAGRQTFIAGKLARYRDLTGKDYPQSKEPQVGCGYRF